jgi:hypothetical protein
MKRAGISFIAGSLIAIMPARGDTVWFEGRWTNPDTRGFTPLKFET